MAALAVDLLAAGTAAEVEAVVVGQVGALLGAAVVVLVLADPATGALRVVLEGEVPRLLREGIGRFAGDGSTPWGLAMRTGQAVYLGDATELARRFPLLTALAGRAGLPTEACAAVPVGGPGGTVGAITVGYAGPQAFPPGQTAPLEEIARMTGAALSRTRAIDAERAARRAAEASSRRLRSLQRIGVALAGVTEPRQVVDVVVKVVSDSLGATAAVVAEYDPATGKAVHLVSAGVPEPMLAVGRPFAVSLLPMAVDLVVSGRPILVTSHADRNVRYPDMAGNRVVQERWANLPLAAGGSVKGWVSFGWDEAGPFDDEEIGFLVAMAGHVTAAVERARLLGQARSVAEMLQQSLLPDVGSVPGWERANLYLPAQSGVEVGGDWFDAFPLPDGQIGVAVGDVAGKGTRAAAVMGAARSALRAYAVLDPVPDHVLSRLDDYLARYKPEELITCLYGILDPRDGTFRYANAGHPPGLAVDDRGTRWLDDVLDPPLGIWPGLERRTGRADLSGGPGRAVLVLYTDGLVERRRGHLQEGLDDLAAAARTLPGATDLDVAVTQLCANLAVYDSTVDDRAVIAFRRRLAVPG